LLPLRGGGVAVSSSKIEQVNANRDDYARAMSCLKANDDARMVRPGGVRRRSGDSKRSRRVALAVPLGVVV